MIPVLTARVSSDPCTFPTPLRAGSWSVFFSRCFSWDEDVGHSHKKMNQSPHRDNIVSEGQLRPTSSDQDRSWNCVWGSVSDILSCLSPFLMSEGWPCGWDCFPRIFSRPCFMTVLWYLYNVLSPQIVRGLHLPSILQSLDQLECTLLLPLWFPHPLLMTQLYCWMESFEVLYQVFETCDYQSIYGGTQGTKNVLGGNIRARIGPLLFSSHPQNDTFWNRS